MAADPSQPKPAWQRFLESGGGAALVTVLLGGLLGNWITATYQSRRAENERRYLTHQEYLEERLATIRPTLERIGHTVASAEDLITITRPDFDPQRFPPGREREATVATRSGIREAYNGADAAWRREKENLGYLLAYYHSGAPGVYTAWDELETAVTAFVDCSRSWWVAHAREATGQADTACAEERTAVDRQMGELIEVLDAAATAEAGPR